MKIPETTAQALNEAMHRFDRELRNTRDWERWEQDETHKYALEQDGRLYPVKLIVSMATGFPVGQFSGGDQANGFVEKYGFKPTEIPSRLRGIKTNLELVLSQYVSVTKKESFGSASSIWPVFKALQRSLKSTEAVKNHPNLDVEWSVGLGNWAKVPWVAFLDRRETDTTRKGVYCVFLFREDMSGVYLTLNQGVQELNDEKGRAEARKIYHGRAQAIRQTVPELSENGFRLDDGIDLRPGAELGKDYQQSTIAYKFYEKENVPDDDQVRSDLGALLQAYDKYVSLNKPSLNKCWIFQANPEYYDIDGALKQLKQQTWSVSQYKDKIHAGDRVYVWESGQQAGILAIATVLTEPAMINFPEQEKPFVRDMDQFEGLHLAVIIRHERILPKRLNKKELMGDAILKELSIIRNPRGTNFEVTPGQAKRLAELLGSDNQPVLGVGGEAMSIPQNRILYGPPGTGKTYWTMRKAVEICDGSFPENDALIRDRYRKLCEENRIEFVTFHQSYGYEDFVEGIRPLLAENGEEEGTSSAVVRYECRDGSFKRICSFAASSGLRAALGAPLDVRRQRVWKMSLGHKGRSDQAEIYDQCIENNQIRLGYGKGLDFTGCDDRQAVAEKHKAAKASIKDEDFSIDAVNRFKNEMQVGDLVVVSDGNFAFRAIGRVVGTYSVLPEGTQYRQMRPVEWLLILDKSLPVERILTKSFVQPTIYRLREPVLRLDALNELLSGEPKSRKNYVLIIDEINRGNIAKIFGELISLIEVDKRIGAVNELRAALPYSGEKFGVPDNLFLLGTMNTADRSIAFLDTALRRRFRFEEMMPDMEVVRRHVGESGVVDSIDVAALVEQINGRIEHLFDRDHQIGHAYFLGVNSLKNLLEVFRFQVIPLLQEYFYNDWAKICVVLGCPHDPTTGKSLTKNPLPLIKVETCDAVDADMVDGVEPRFRYRLNTALNLEGADLMKCFRWIIGVPAESIQLPVSAGNPET